MRLMEEGRQRVQLSGFPCGVYFSKDLVFILCICVWTQVYVFAPHACRYPWKTEEGVGFPGTVVTGDCEAQQESSLAL